MSGVADHRLIEISDFDFNLSLRVRDRAQIAQMTVAANQYGRPSRYQIAARRLQPVIELERVAPNVSVRGASHFHISGTSQERSPRVRPRGRFVVFHFRLLSAKYVQYPSQFARFELQEGE